MNRLHCSRSTSIRSRRSRVNPALERLEARCLMAGDGDLDTTFGQGGSTSVDISPFDWFSDITLQPDPSNPGAPRIVGVGGLNANTTSEDSFVIRVTDSGTLDPTFASGGTFTHSFAKGSDELDAVSVDPATGGIVAAGNAISSGSNAQLLVARLTPNGALDTSFGGHGYVITSIPNTIGSDAYAVSALPQGKVLIGGAARFSSGKTSDWDLFLAQYNANGSLDTSFGNGGIFALDLGKSGESVSSIHVNYDTTGAVQSITAFGGGGASFEVFRVNASGVLDRTFGGGTGYALITPNAQAASLNPGRLAVDNQGRLVGSGRITDASGARGAVVLVMDPNTGQLDSTFAANDSRYPNGVDTVPGGDLARDVVTDPQGRIVVMGQTRNALPSGNFEYDLLLARLNATGGLDPSFGSGGVVTSTVAGGIANNGLAGGVALDGNRIVVGANGYADPSHSNAVVARFWNTYPSSSSTALASAQVFTAPMSPAAQNILGLPSSVTETDQDLTALATELIGAIKKRRGLSVL